MKALTSGKITSDYIGKTVYLSNSVITCQEWIIADVNHDSTSGTVDLISKTTLTNDKTQFNINGLIYKSSTLDTYLESTVYNGFSASIKNALNNMSVPSYTGSSYDYDDSTKVVTSIIERHVIAPSLIEVGDVVVIANNNALIEGNIYPIFGSAVINNSKSVFNDPNGTARTYWTRTAVINTYSDIWCKNTYGTQFGSDSDNNWYVVARIRFAKS